MEERILVTGATGKVGRELVRLLLDGGAQVMAATRDPETARRIFGHGLEVRELDFRAAATYDDALQWADRVFLQPPPFHPDVHGALSSFVDWAVQAGTRHLVTVSAMGIEVREDLPIRRLERLIHESGIEWTQLRPNLYMQNFGAGFLGGRIRRTGAFSLPVEGSRVSFVDGRDVAAVAAAALTSEDHFGRAFTLTGPEALSHAEVAELITRASGRPVEFSTTSDEQMVEWLVGAGWRRDVAGVIISLFQSVRAGVRERVTLDVEEVLGRPATGFATWAKDRSDVWEGDPD